MLRFHIDSFKGEGTNNRKPGEPIRLDKYNNKCRIASAHLQYWGYRWAGVYCISICTHNTEPYWQGYRLYNSEQ